MSAKNKSIVGLSGLLFLAVLFVAVVLLSNTLLRGVRVDLTENKLYTVSEGSRNILASLDEPVNLYFFFSNRATEGQQVLRAYANRVREFLEEFKLHSNGKLNLNVIDPLAFSEEEDRATQFGLQGVSLGLNSDTIYFGLAGTNAVDDVALIEFFRPDKEAFLEYDIAKLVYTLANPEKPAVGLMTTLPMDRRFDQETRRLVDPWVVLSQIESLFEVRRLDSALTVIDEDVDILMLVHPKELGSPTLYAIDQFILRGGKALIFVDPLADAEVPQEEPGNPYAALTADRSSNLRKLFDVWGLDFSQGQVLADRRHALSVRAAAGAPPVPHLGVLGYQAQNFDSDDIVTAELTSLNLATAGFLTLDDEAVVTLVPLVWSSDETQPMPTQRMVILPDPSTLRDGFEATGEEYVIAARLEGRLQTAFPDGDPAADPVADTTHVSESADVANIIVVGDTDLLTDMYWVQVQSFFGQRLLSAHANNADFVINALDNLSGSSDLISVRGRAAFTRPFHKVDELKRQAEDRYLATEKQLEDQLAATEARLSELQFGRDDDDLMILNAEQEAEIRRFTEERVRIRKELRKVRRDLDRSIESLGTRLKLINIGLVPLLITLIALVVASMRQQRRKQS